MKTRIQPQNYKWVIIAAIAAILIKSFRRPIGLVFIIMGLPAIYHLIRRDDSETNPISFAMLLGGAAMWWLS